MGVHHHIHCQRLILEAPDISPAEAGGWYERLRTLQSSTILPALERQLEKLDVSDREILIDRLEITVEVADPKRLENGFSEQLEKQLQSALTQAMQSSVTRKPINLPFFHALTHYLLTGTLSGAYASPAAFMRALGVWLAETDDTAITHLLPLLARDVPRFIGRCTQVQSELLEQCWHTLLRRVGEWPQAQAYSGDVPTDPVRWQELLAKAGFYSEISVPATTEPETAVDQLAVPQAEVQASEALTSYYPHNAGIVLLHPYLQHLLKTVGCEIERRTPKALGRAAALFHFTVFGNEQVGEWDLPLTKLLLGLNPEDLLLPANELSVTDRAAADELLDGIIEHWTALKGTSRDGLREGFLQRPGKLERRAGGWRLTVEQQPHDMLLDRLPWNLSLVKTPWMPELLKVDWA